MTSKVEILPSDEALSGLPNAATITARAKSNFSSAFIFLPAEKRLAMKRVYAFFRVIDDVVDEEPNPLRQKTLIDSWKRELDNTYKGTTIVPLLQELKESIDRFHIPKDYFLKLIEGCEMDITKTRYETFEELYEYCYRVASMVGLVCMKIFEFESPTSQKTAIDLGIALQLTNIIRDVGVDYFTKGRIYLPYDDLKRFGITANDIENKTMTPPLRALLNFQYERAVRYYESGVSEFNNDKHNKLLAARIMASVYRTILEKIRKKDYPVLEPKPLKLSFTRKMLILARVMLFSH
ncbi:squalene/phytoene synthase family protein [bacterium]|nr:squalene/phytoene synthase family protein [bacterium]